MVLKEWLISVVFQAIVVSILLVCGTIQAVNTRTRDQETKWMQIRNLFTVVVLCMWTVDPYAAFGIWPWYVQVILIDLIESSILWSGIKIVDRIVAASYLSENKNCPKALNYVANFTRLLVVIGYAADPPLVYITDKSQARTMIHIVKFLVLTLFGGAATYLIYILRTEVRAMIKNKLVTELSKSGGHIVAQKHRLKYERVEKKLTRTMIMFSSIIVTIGVFQIVFLYQDLARTDNGYKEDERKNKTQFNLLFVLLPYTYVLIISAWIHYSWVPLWPSALSRAGSRASRGANTQPVSVMSSRTRPRSNMGLSKRVTSSQSMCIRVEHMQNIQSHRIRAQTMGQHMDVKSASSSRLRTNTAALRALHHHGSEKHGGLGHMDLRKETDTSSSPPNDRFKIHFMPARASTPVSDYSRDGTEGMSPRVNAHSSFTGVRGITTLTSTVLGVDSARAKDTADRVYSSKGR
ncbi:hypothetical protein AAMO2058_000284900 [Amorphochlora amoebiformis]